MRVLVCGGRDFTDIRFIETALENLLFSGSVIPSGLFIMEGQGPGVKGQPSCDELVFRWRLRMGVGGQRFPVVHAVDGAWPAAGPRRNSRMLKDGKPEMGIAFPGYKGTADMVGKMKAKGIKVVELEKTK
jgi:hypothetical protein